MAPGRALPFWSTVRCAVSDSHKSVRTMRANAHDWHAQAPPGSPSCESLAAVFKVRKRGSTCASAMPTPDGQLHDPVVIHSLEDQESEVCHGVEPNQEKRPQKNMSSSKSRQMVRWAMSSGSRLLRMGHRPIQRSQHLGNSSGQSMCVCLLVLRQRGPGSCASRGPDERLLFSCRIQQFPQVHAFDRDIILVHTERVFCALAWQSSTSLYLR